LGVAESSSPTFGALFAGSHELFRLIPQVSILASRRLAEEAAGSARPSASLKHAHDAIHSLVTSWEMPPQPPRSASSATDWEHRRVAAETVRQALHICLATALAGSVVSDPAATRAIEDHIVKLFSCAPRLLASRYIATAAWPVAIGGSCMSEPEQQKALLREMRTGWYSMGLLGVLGDVLQLLWDDPDPRSYGPYGLYLTMEKHGLNLGIA
jgi:hypothetical protein